MLRALDQESTMRCLTMILFEDGNSIKMRNRERNLNVWPGSLKNGLVVVRVDFWAFGIKFWRQRSEQVYLQLNCILCYRQLQIRFRVTDNRIKYTNRETIRESCHVKKKEIKSQISKVNVERMGRVLPYRRRPCTCRL